MMIIIYYYTMNIFVHNSAIREIGFTSLRCVIDLIWMSKSAVMSDDLIFFSAKVNLKDTVKIQLIHTFMPSLYFGYILAQMALAPLTLSPTNTCGCLSAFLFAYSSLYF